MIQPIALIRLSFIILSLSTAAAAAVQDAQNILCTNLSGCCLFSHSGALYHLSSYNPFAYFP